jgi:hypothetical protein
MKRVTSGLTNLSKISLFFVLLLMIVLSIASPVFAQESNSEAVPTCVPGVSCSDYKERKPCNDCSYCKWNFFQRKCMNR